ncbi:MAG TPA: PhoH family protein [Erysipelothrix sp.]|nr:PhoH family protein [Erysipelothrix sp.]
MSSDFVKLEMSVNQLQILSGVEQKNIHKIEECYDVSLNINKETITIKGSDENIDKTKRLLKSAFIIIEKFNHLDHHDLDVLCKAVEHQEEEVFLEAIDHVITRTYTGKPIRAKSLGQRTFIDSIIKHDLTFAIGPAGTGKTFLAICMAVDMLKKGDVKKIILTRPAVEAGENLGFLPGDLKEKVDPYLRPLYDSLDEMLSSNRTERYIESGVIEIAPLAYMRGRTLDDAIVILDEAQNTTKAQMLMFLSRLGRNSKMIVTGDLTQTDLLEKQESGLRIAKKRLANIKGIGFVSLGHKDVVRHPLVVKILEAFA